MIMSGVRSGEPDANSLKATVVTNGHNRQNFMPGGFSVRNMSELMKETNSRVHD